MPKHVAANSHTRKVAIVELSDQTESGVELQIWDVAYALVKGLPFGEDLTIIRCSAQRDTDGVQVNLNL